MLDQQAGWLRKKTEAGVPSAADAGTPSTAPSEPGDSIEDTPDDDTAPPARGRQRPA